MQIDKKAIQDRLRKFDFTGVFAQELGWDFPPGNLTLTIAREQVQLQAVSEKRGLVAYVCPAQTSGCVQDHAIRRGIEREVTNTHTQRWQRAHGKTGYADLYQGRFKSFPLQTDDHFSTLVRNVERSALGAPT